jgi:hypothetical protein
MRQWMNIVETGEEGYLYHWMDMDKGAFVFEHDEMPGRWTHIIGQREIAGNSFSRNKVMSFGEERCVRLTVDKRALAARHKIIPLDAELVHFRTRSRGKEPAARIRDRVMNSSSGSHFAEEFVVGDIVDLSRYIVKVDIRCFHSGLFYSFCQDAKQYCHTHDLNYEFSDCAIKFMKDTEARWAEDD